MILRCHHCKNEWDYRGKSKKYVTCPACHYKINISKTLTDIDLTVSYNELITRISKLENMITDIQNSITLNNRIRNNPINPDNMGVHIRCSKCGYSWYYRGLKRNARCPECNSRVNVQEHKITD